MRILLLIGIFGGLMGCSRTRVGRVDCTRILDRLIEAQFKKMNLADPELLMRRKMEFQSLFKDDLTLCESMELSVSVKTCIEAPDFNTGDIHRCFALR